ncbi:WD40-repeat-containing domain protein [Lipomyces arxii]|uniref:WD40-repeat-containing domain protein n=1 Tax=Lipomyces arxii TaxID=56418 RepID=UPI0034CDDB00
MLSRKHQKFLRGTPARYLPEYVYSLDQLTPSKIVSSLSDRTLRVLDVGSGSSIVELSKLKGHEANISGVSVIDSNMLVSSGEDGAAKVWDIRTNSVVNELKCKKKSPLLSIDYSRLSSLVATGTELVKQDAEVLIWDLRSACTPVKEYVDSHNDDVTCVTWHQTVAHSLLSGSTDGLVTRYDTSISDEDEAVMQVINHNASVHSTGFFDQDIYVLSHVETFSIYKQTDKDDEGEDDKPENVPVDFGDVRETWDCEYVIGIGKSFAAVGANSENKLALIPMKGAEVCLDRRVDLSGAHGAEVVRCVLVDDGNSRIFTGGEDGQINVWLSEGRAGRDSSQWSGIKSDQKKNRKCLKETRFKPY